MNQDTLQYFYDPIEIKCPTCSLSLQGDPECRRCKTDMTLLIQTAKHSWKLREKARLLLLSNDYGQALHYAQKAQGIHRTAMGGLIEQLAWIALEKHRAAGYHLHSILFE